ncbi:MAG: ABC transporter ATP-binding protein [Pirellulaceae bacterium]
MTTPAKSASVRFGQTELSNRQLVLRLLRLAWRYRWGCLLVLLLQGVLLWTAVVAVQLSGIGIDLIRHHLDPSIQMPRLPWNVALPATSPMSQVAVVAGLVLLVAVVRAVMNYTHAVVAGDLVHRRIVVDLRAEVFDKMQHASFRFFDANATGSLINRVTGDVQSLRSFIDAVLIQLILLAISLVVYLILLFRIHVGLTFACLATTPLMWLITVRFSKTVRPLYDFNRELNDRMILDLAENVQGVHVIKGFGLQHAEIAKFGNSNRQVQQQQQSIFWRVSLFSPTVQFMTQINLVILLIYGGYLVAQNRLELGTGLVVFAGLLQQFSSQVSNLAGLANSMQQSMTGARRVFEVLDTPVEISNGPQPQPLEQVKGHIRFEHVWFAYADEDWVLQDVSFEVTPGESLAIVGETGAESRRY